ncbi:hypothetical protein K488DRAFT_91112 [Vararia minispora EC-137]|uniref:Uncharacterized protein n=1 Tax=Vararia minispora EC-137 TaxID=1314806 RepID=A0ACB8Q6D3_9AGAM|nr:hypothetical protein K488DRAFT_91112 [Vararia minispora EC-137]
MAGLSTGWTVLVIGQWFSEADTAIYAHIVVLSCDTGEIKECLLHFLAAVHSIIVSLRNASANPIEGLMGGVLHRKYKLAYFQQQGWESEWIETARELAQEHYNRFYRPPPPDLQAPRKGTSDVNMGDVASLFAVNMVIPDEVNEFEAYLAAPLMPIKDPLKHWHAMLPSPLARMALDALTAPASSADVERAFSTGLEEAARAEWQVNPRWNPAHLTKAKRPKKKAIETQAEVEEVE